VTVQTKDASNGSTGRMIKLKRVYETPETSDGLRVLVERLWPRGMKKKTLNLDEWLKDVAPSSALRRWFGHDPARWDEFRQRYTAELNAHPAAWQPILEAAHKSTVTLLFSSHDVEHNNAVALRAYLETRSHSTAESMRRRDVRDHATVHRRQGQARRLDAFFEGDLDT
jgi:uncharacterized protein YeaO (DUF488 family)